MAGKAEYLRGVSVFERLTDDELALVAELGSVQEHAKDDVIFHEGEAGTSMYVVLEGAVEIQSRVSEGLHKTIATARPGKVFGLVSLVDRGERPSTARAAEKARTLTFDRRQFEELAERHPDTANKFVLNLAVELASTMRLVAEEYKQTIRWGLEVSGATQLNLHRLITERATVEVDLLNGKTVTGVILAVDHTAGGVDIILRTAEGKLCDIPYHAVARATFEVDVLRPATDAVSGLRRE